MRLANLQLIRYGKFTDVEIPLPQTECDFHLFVGPNEAGKSTLRSAISELLFGFPVRSRAMSFLHPQSELRLGGLIADDKQSLNFVRIKANKNSLRTSSDEVIADNELDLYLGATDKDFFEQMFALDHLQLVRGGETILDASKDVSQVLFQSAAGVAGLGEIKASLLEERDRLWTPRASGTRAYYIASSRWEEACRELKAVTIRSKAWVEAKARFESATTSIDAIRSEAKELELIRSKLERIRRLGPTVQVLKTYQLELGRLGEVIEFPNDALTTVEHATQELSVATALLERCDTDIGDLRTARDAISFDSYILDAKHEIEELEAFRQRVRDHYADLQTQELELKKFLGLAQAAAKELGWPEDEAQFRQLLPTTTKVREIQRLVTSHGKLYQIKDDAARALSSAEDELENLNAQLRSAEVRQVPASLRVALSTAQSMRNSGAALKKLRATVAVAEGELANALARLGQWKASIEDLEAMALPCNDRLAALIAERQQIAVGLANAKDREEEARLLRSRAVLAPKQFSETKHIVTPAQVRDARTLRDEKWSSIKSGATPIQVGAADLDASIALADELADTQLGSANEAATLLGLQQNAELAETEYQERKRLVEARASDLDTFDQTWRTLFEASGLSGMDLSDAPAWISKRDQAIAAGRNLVSKRTDLDSELESVSTASSALRSELLGFGEVVGADVSLPALMFQAEHVLTAGEADITRRKLLTERVAAGQTSIRRLKVNLQSANDQYNSWSASWKSALAAAKLDSSVASVDDAEACLSLVDAVRSNLERANDTKRDRIDPMAAELRVFAGMASSLAERIGATPHIGDDPRSITQEALSRLRDAEALATRKSSIEQTLNEKETQREQAQGDVDRIKAWVSPIFSIACTTSLDVVSELVKRSNAKRQLEARVAEARSLLASDSDGFGIDAVVAEVDACDFSQLPAEIDAAKEKLARVQDQLTVLAEERLRAEGEFQAIDGGRNASNIESRRHEALAEMAEFAERYVKTTAAVSLLKWAIDRYRDENQGPMLARAGAIFSKLTLGRYVKLFVDYEKTPLSLSALSAQGREIEVSGMSEGTRDQLYLALRLAALELHLRKAKPLPFIADDLFVNFDDERATAGFAALRDLSRQTQVLFLSHHDHLIPRVREVFGGAVNVITLVA